MVKHVRIGTRGSQLALWQADFVASRLRELGVESVEIVKIKTTGDKILDAPLAKIGDKGLFVKEIEVALSEGAVDVAVHSMKDMPTEIPAGLTIAAILEREDPRDALVSKGPGLGELPEGAVIGTSSLRRKAQLHAFRRDFSFVDVRGNLNTRLRKMEEGRFDAMILAVAGLRRMGWSDRVTEILDPSICLSAVSQGAIGVEAREDDSAVLGVLESLDHGPTRTAVLAERALMRCLEGGCQIPVGALGQVQDDEGSATLGLQGLVASLDGGRLVRDEVSGAADEAERLGVALAERLLADGGREILDEIRAETGELGAAESLVFGDHGTGGRRPND